MKSLPVTVIITVWKRLYLEEQLDAILLQTALPSEIWIIHYEDHIDIIQLVNRFRERFPAIFLIRSDKNLKYFGRFSIASHVTSEYTWLIDDDIVPGKRWLELSHQKCAALNAVIGCSGRIIPKGIFVPEKGEYPDPEKYFVGDGNESEEMNCCEEDTIVDFACNSYFIRSRWIRDFWAIWPSTFNSGEDIHLSASLKICQNIPTIVPAQNCAESTGNRKKAYGRDQHSSWLKPGFFTIREGVFRDLITVRGWKPLLWQQASFPQLAKP